MNDDAYNASFANAWAQRCRTHAFEREQYEIYKLGFADGVAAAEGNSEMSDWRPIETARKTGRDILVFGYRERDGQVIPYRQVSCWYHGKWTIEWMDQHRAPTHWMPLPEPPA